MTCLFCHKGPMHGVTIHRVNAKGQPGVWACSKHIQYTDATIPADVKALTDLIDGTANQIKQAQEKGPTP